MFETIVSLASAPIKSALMIIRVSGDDCFFIVSKCFDKDLTKVDKRSSFVGFIKDKDEIIDQVVLLAYKGPKSFTGEDMVEIICHGSVLIAKQIIDLLISFGARQATNGEYSSRAFLHGKVDLIQAEAINDTINATSQESKRLSLLSLQGKTSELIYPIKTKIADIASLIEVNIDFPEYEDIEIANKSMIQSSVIEIVKTIDLLINNGEKGKIIKDGISVAIVGKPNVGKSSILNAILGEDKAIVTDQKGTTRDIVEGQIIYKGITIRFLDTAGIRNSNDKIENLGINKSKESIKNADIVIVVLDSLKLDIEDQEILDLTSENNRIIVYNKSDVNNFKDGIVISAKNNDINPLLNEIYNKLGLSEENFINPSLSNDRQLSLLLKAKNSLLKAYEDAENDLTVDLISVSIMEAYNAILEILGEYNQKDISREIFSRFCVGK